MTIKSPSLFPFRRDNRRPDGTWDAPDASDENIKGTSVDPYAPRWPRWKQKPPPHGEGEFISDDPYFDIDEIRQTVDFYPPGRPLADKNAGDNPASRQRVGDMPGGNLWRRRLLVGPVEQVEQPPGRAALSVERGNEPSPSRIDSPHGHLSAPTFGSSGDEERSEDNRALGQHAANDVLVSDQSRMVTSPEGREFIKRHEGPGPNAYSDPTGFPTIGYGHKLTPSDATVLPPNTTLSDAAAGALLTQDIEAAERAVYRNVTNVGALSQQQFDALVSFVFNVGEANFRNSRMHALINSGNYAGAANEFRRFVFSRGTRLPGLASRRTSEENLFSKGAYQ